MSRIRYEFPGWDAPSHVYAVTTKRAGGVSKAPFDSLNLGDHVGDDMNDVVTNRELIQQDLKLPSMPQWLNQVHETNIVDAANIQRANRPDADGAFCDKPGVICAVLTADCMPVFMSNKAGTKVVVLHAGWRGMAQGILERGVACFSDSPTELLAWAGPCIGPALFEVGIEVRERLGGSDEAYSPTGNSNKLLANLYQLAGERLRNVGVDCFGFSDSCTYRDSDDFFSYRRDGLSGRMASLIWIDPT